MQPEVGSLPDDELLEALKLKLSAQRGYADFDSWPDRPVKDAGLGNDLAVALRSLLQVDLAGLRTVPQGFDPPDLIAAGPIGIELTELVDSDMVEAAVRQQRAGQPPGQYRHWTKEQLQTRLRQIIARKDAGVPKTRERWSGYWLVIHTDEPALTPDIVRSHLAEWPPAQCRLLTRCFLLMSYFPAQQGRPLFELQLCPAA